MELQWVCEQCGEREDASDVADEADRLRARVARLEAALRQIQKGEGRFSRDQYEFACNVIEEAKETARAALAGDES